MRHRALLGILCCAMVAPAPAPARAAGQRDSMIVSVAWLARHLADSDLVVLHVGTKEGYDAAHIPGARFISTADISLPRKEGALVLELPAADVLKDAFERLGVSNDSRVVVYYGDDWVTPTARVFFTLDYIGLGDHTSVLDGGMREWTATGHAVTAEAPTVVRGHLRPKPRPDLVVDAGWVKAHLGDRRVAIVDARNTEFFAGTKAGDNMRAGHIPSAKSIPFIALVPEPRLTFLDAEAMRDVFRRAGVAPGSKVVPYCHIGQQASLVYFAARYLGYDVRLYDGSFQDWSQRSDLPVEAPGAAAPKP